MFNFFNRLQYADDEITIVLNRQYREEPTLGIEKTYYFHIFLNETKRVIGYVDLRVGESLFLYYLGNVGYRINESYRGHHYAAKAVKLLLPLAKEEGMRRLLITCNPDNIASYKTIEAAGGRFLEECEVPSWHELYERQEKRKCVFEIKL